MNYKLLLFLLCLYTLSLNASSINIVDAKQEILSNSSYYVDYEDKSFEEIQTLKLTKRAGTNINLAFDSEARVWVKLEFYNTFDREIERVLEVENPMVPKVVLYDKGKISIAGMFFIQPDQDHLNAAFFLTFKPHEHRTVWISIENAKTTLQFELFLKPEKVFYHDNLIRQITITFFLGAIVSLLLFSLMVAIYARNGTYFYYSFYLSALIYQQLVYSGLLQLHVPQWVTDFNDHMNIPMVAIVIVAASWYAMNFLETKRYQKIDKTYKLFILLIIVQVPFLGLSYFYVPDVVVYTGLVFIFFNTYAGYYIYKQGYTQARFFIAGWIILILFYMLLIMDSLGIYTTPNLPIWMMFATSVEALFLLLAYVDLFALAEKEKKRLNSALIDEYRLRQNLIEGEVAVKTEELSLALDQKEVLYKELHHRVKNNLQLILSISRLQQHYSDDKTEHAILKQYENRIGAISKVHELLYQSDYTGQIDMSIYIKELIEGMKVTLQELSIRLNCEVKATLPTRESIYVGLVINELVSNAVKYAYDEEGGEIYIRLQQSGSSYDLEVYDEGDREVEMQADKESLGLKLIDTLVVMQLKGSIEVDSSRGVHYKIRFSV